MNNSTFRAASVAPESQGWYAQILVTALDVPDFYQTIGTSPYFPTPEQAVAWAENVWS